MVFISLLFHLSPLRYPLGLRVRAGQPGDHFLERERINRRTLFGCQLSTRGFRPADQFVAGVSHPSRVWISPLGQQFFRFAFDQTD